MPRRRHSKGKAKDERKEAATVQVTVATFNVYMWRNGRAQDMARLLKKAGVQVACLQEVEMYHDGRDIKELVRCLGPNWNWHWHGSKRIKFGNAIISSLPTHNVRTVNLATKGRETRYLITCDLEVAPHFTIPFACVHLDHMHEEFRVVQLKQMVKAMGGQYDESKVGDETPPSSAALACARSYVLGGDFNSLLRSDYSEEKWTKIDAIRRQNYWEECRTEAMSYLLDDVKLRDACAESLKQARAEPPIDTTCRFDTRIDFILLPDAGAAPAIQAIPGSYKVHKTNLSDHSLVAVALDITIPQGKGKGRGKFNGKG